jgi:hypothetical protein
LSPELGWIRNLTLLAIGAAAGYFIGRRLTERDFADEQKYLMPKRLLLDLDDGQGFTLWTEVAALADAGPEDQVFVIDAAGSLLLGDGVHGHRPPVDRGTLKAKYET